MAKLYIKSGKRGRPLSIDPEKELHKLVFENIPKARERLAEIKKQSSGIREERLIGGANVLPEYIESSIDVLQDLKEGENIDYDTLKELKKNLRTVERLSSKQERVFGSALEQQFTEDYIKSLDYFSRAGSDFVKKSNERVKNMLQNLTPKQRQQAFLSKGYQDIATMSSQSDRRVQAWARKESGNQELTVDEAWAYLRERRWADELGG